MNITTAMIVFPVLLVGILFQFTPLLTRRGIYFSATVAAGFPQSGDGRRLLRSYRMQAALWTLAAVGLSMLLFRACPIYGVLAPMLLLLVGTGFSYWLKFRDIHEHYGETRPEIRQAELVTPVAQQSFHPQLWILPFAALAVTAFYLHAHWSQLPESFPVHWGPDGHPNRWSTRDGSGVYGPLLIGTGVNLLLLALAWLFTRYSRNTVMRRVTIRLTELLLYPITFSFVMLALLPLVQLPIWLVPAVIAISIAAIIYWSYRQITSPAADSDAVPEPQKDSYWKAGVFYFNPGDPAIFVAKRVGIGYTMNFANLWAWLILLAVIGGAILLATHHG